MGYRDQLTTYIDLVWWGGGGGRVNLWLNTILELGIAESQIALDICASNDINQLTVRVLFVVTVEPTHPLIYTFN